MLCSPTSDTTPQNVIHGGRCTYLQGVKFDLHLPPASKLISQPPADSHLGEAAMFHYTWCAPQAPICVSVALMSRKSAEHCATGCRGTVWSDETGKEVWKFDKRFYTDANLEIDVRSQQKLAQQAYMHVASRCSSDVGGNNKAFLSDIFGDCYRILDTCRRR